MKITLLLLALLGSATLGHAQTAPSAPAASGTKNVGADRADAPQAPGMQQAAAPMSKRASSAKAPKKARLQRAAASASPAPRN